MFPSRRSLLTLGCGIALTTTTWSVAEASRFRVGDTLPNVSLDSGYPPDKVALGELCKGKKIVLVGLPGAFSPTCSERQIPGYLEKQAELKKKGVSDVVMFSVNDGAVMQAWAKDQKTEGSMIKLLADTHGELTLQLGVVVLNPKALRKFGRRVCKRFSMLVEDCKIKTFNLAASVDDPTGDDEPESSLVEKMLEDLSPRDEL